MRCTAEQHDSESGHAMILEQGAAEAEVKIRMPRHAWMLKLAAGVLWLAGAAFYLWNLQLVLAALVSLAVSGVLVTGALWHRNLGVDLTRESAILRGFRRRTVPWHEVQAVVRQRRFDSWVVQLIPESGRPVKLLAPTSSLDLGAAQFERDFHRIEQWWLAHRGKSWRPLLPEAVRNQYGLPNTH
jgi:hypothetical protein